MSVGTILLILLFIAAHLVMHRGHASHARHASAATPARAGDTRDGARDSHAEG